jgi:hypothetical protein
VRLRVLLRHWWGIRHWLLLAALVIPVAAHAQDKLDNRRPLPPPERPHGEGVPQKYVVPNRDSAIFQGRIDARGARISNTGIVDFERFASEVENSDEYQAWTIVVLHANQFTAAELEQHAARDLTRDDLTALPSAQLTGNPRILYRLDLIRFDGRLVRVRWVETTAALQQAGVKEMYEALIVPTDEPLPADKAKAATYAVSIAFTELPEALAAVKQQKKGEWMEVDAPATAAGYFFKVKQDFKDDATPVLVGKSVTMLKAEPAPPGPNPAVLDKNLRIFKFIKDRAYIAKGEDNWEEASAWNYVLLHARRFTPAELERHANGELKFYHLFEDSRRDYKLDLVKFEGRLIMIKKMKPTEKLKAVGVETVYEGWLVPRDEPSGHPVCIVFTDLPEGIEVPPDGRVNKWVTFAGYSFKLLRYRSGERDKEDPNKYIDKLAPLLLGRAPIVRTDPDAPTGWSFGGLFVPAVVVGVGLLIVFALVVGWWFRRGDKRARMEMEAHRNRNPFGEPGSA